jgi:hypothetical protein
MSSLPPNRPLERTSWIREFLYGAEYVHSRYLSLLWRYSIVKSLAITVPLAVLLWGSHFYSTTFGAAVYTFVFRILHAILSVSSGVARLLHLPLAFMKWTLTAVPGMIIAFLEYLPNFVAVHLVKALLFAKDTISTAATVGGVIPQQHEILAFLCSVLAVLVWRPAVEEWQYRSILNKFMFAPGAIQRLSGTVTSRNNPIGQTSALVEFIPLTGPEQQQHQRIPPPPDDDVSMTAQEDVSGRSDDDSNAGAVRKSDLPLPTESTRMLVGSLLFAATRLGWLSTDPAGGDLYASPYGRTIGFLQSVLTHFSSHVMVEVRPSLRIWILLLAVHQAASSFLVAQHVFAHLYRQRGLAASVGAHVAWTVSKGTVGFRLLWRLWLAAYRRSPLRSMNR